MLTTIIKKKYRKLGIKSEIQETTIYKQHILLVIMPASANGHQFSKIKVLSLLPVHCRIAGNQQDITDFFLLKEATN